MVIRPQAARKGRGWSCPAVPRSGLLVGLVRARVRRLLLDAFVDDVGALVERQGGRALFGRHPALLGGEPAGHRRLRRLGGFRRGAQPGGFASGEPRGPGRRRERPEAGGRGRGRARQEALIAGRRDKTTPSPCGPPAAVSPSHLPAAKEVAMAKGQMRVPKEKKKPKADKDKPKQLSAYKLSQQQGVSGSPFNIP